jgi:UPF0755 protein
MPKRRPLFFRIISIIWRNWLLSAVTVVGLILAGFFVWYQLGLQALPAAEATTFRIGQGDSLQTIATHLQEQGLIRNREAFMVYVAFHGLLRRMQSGVYAIPAHAAGGQIADMIAHGQVNAKQLTIPEGVTVAKIRELAAAQGISEDSFNAALGQTYDFSFLKGRPAGVGLEGYLFPDSYTVNADTSAGELVKVMLTTFETKAESYQRAFEAEGLTLHQGITLASMVEKEVASDSDRRMVAGIFLNRIKAGQALQSDVTVNYAAALLGVGFSTTLDSPYNTYKNPGLPIGPICNPGLSAIEAAAHPNVTDYQYFLAGKDGKTHFTKTFEEHQQNIAQYLK